MRPTIPKIWISIENLLGWIDELNYFVIIFDKGPILENIPCNILCISKQQADGFNIILKYFQNLGLNYLLIFGFAWFIGEICYTQY